MKKIILICIAAAALMTSGCVTMQSSVYTNRSTAAGNEVYATGEAAIAAAASSSSYNCPSCVRGGAMGRRGGYQPSYYRPRRDPGVVDQIYREASNTLSREIGYRISSEIRNAFRGDRY